jgi:hypothetical protein
MNAGLRFDEHLDPRAQEWAVVAIRATARIRVGRTELALARTRCLKLLRLSYVVFPIDGSENIASSIHNCLPLRCSRGLESGR